MIHPPAEYVGSLEQQFWGALGLGAFVLYCLVRCVCGRPRVIEAAEEEEAEESENNETEREGRNRN